MPTVTVDNTIQARKGVIFMIDKIQVSERASAIVIHNRTVYLSGQVAADPDASIEDQTTSTLARVDALLATAGTDKSRLLTATIYLRDIDAHFARMNSVWNGWVTPGMPPARACVQAHLAREALLVEICVTAALED